MDKRMLLGHCFQCVKSISCILEGFTYVTKGSQIRFHRLLKEAVSNVTHSRTSARCSQSTPKPACKDTDVSRTLSYLEMGQKRVVTIVQLKCQ